MPSICLDLPVWWNQYDRLIMEPEGTQLLRIGEIAKLLSLSSQTLLNYEQEGLLKPTARSQARHRLYGAEEVAQLQFIKRANLAGITKAEVKELLALIAKGEEGENVSHVKEVLEEKIRETARTIEEISAFRDSLLYYRGRFEEKEDQEGHH